MGHYSTRLKISKEKIFFPVPTFVIIFSPFEKKKRSKKKFVCILISTRGRSISASSTFFSCLHFFWKGLLHKVKFKKETKMCIFWRKLGWWKGGVNVPLNGSLKKMLWVLKKGNKNLLRKYVSTCWIKKKHGYLLFLAHAIFVYGSAFWWDSFLCVTWFINENGIIEYLIFFLAVITFDYHDAP